MNENKLSIVYVGDTTENSFTDVFIDVAETKSLEKRYLNKLYHLPDIECAKKYGYRYQPGLLIFRKFDDSPLSYNGMWEHSQIVNWLEKASIPNLLNFEDDYSDVVFNDKNPTLFLFRSTSDVNTPYSQVFEEASRKFKGQIHFAVGDVSTLGPQ